MVQLRTATSKTSFWPPLVVSRALKMEGSSSVSNLTIEKYQQCSVDRLRFF